MSSETDPYLAILKASYDYDPQSDDEITIKENQLLFLVERVDDDWWKVKIKGDSQEEESPVGLVPAAYVEQADHISVVKVLYEYGAAAAGELSVQEDDLLLVFEEEQDWLLVQSQKEGGKAGFVPGNYVEAYTEGQSPPEPGIVVPPPRPLSTYVDPADRVASAKVTADGIQTWSVSEIDKKGKKKKGTLGIGNGALFFASEADKTPVRKWKSTDLQGVTSEKAKHVVIDIGGTSPISLHFHTGAKDNVDAIITKLNSSKALFAPSNHRDYSDSVSPDITPLPRENQKPSVHFTSASPVIIPSGDGENGDDDEDESHARSPSAGVHQEVQNIESDGELGVALYDFEADGDDELSITEGEQLTILERDGNEWWKCQNSKGDQGVVPASYIEVSDSSHSVAAQVSYHEEAMPHEAEDISGEAERLQAEERLAQQKEAERETERKVEAQRRAKEVADAVDAERKKRKAAAIVSVPSPPADKRGTVPDNNVAGSSQVSVENNRPPSKSTRVWHDRTGQFQVEAVFLGFSNGKLRLHKVNGVIVEVPSEKMSFEDLQYVERMTSKKPPPTQADDDTPLAHSRPTSSGPRSTRSAPPKKASNIDWFDFFLSAGCDLDDCTRYASSFDRDKIDETLLPDITESTMRSLGVREGDIIRIAKAIEKRKPVDNLKKPSAYTEEQIRRDEELARQLQAQESGGARSPAPNLFAGPGGLLKNPRRGRPQPSKSLPPATVDLNAISTVSDKIQRTSSPQILTPVSAQPLPTPVQAPPRSSSAVVPASGFDDDAWTNRPSSTKPLVGTPPAPRVPSAPPTTADPQARVAASPPSGSAIANAAFSAPVTQTNLAPLAKTTESDIFDQLSRLSELRKRTTSPTAPPSAPSSIIPPTYHAGLGMGSSPTPMGRHLQTLPITAPSQSTALPYNGPRGPFAPVPANQNLLQPLIPTQTGFNSFIPTRPSPGLPVSTFPSPPLSYLAPQSTGLPSAQQLMSQPTGVPFNGFNPIHNTGSYAPVPTQFTGFNPNFAQSPFNSGPVSPPPVPPLPSPTSNVITKDTSPANIFAQMKSGTFATDNATSSQPPALTAQVTGWGQPYQGGYVGYQH